MIEHTYRVLEYNRLLDILACYASCAVGRSDCLSIKPSSDPIIVDSELRLVSEMRLLLKVKGFFFFSELEEITLVLKKSLARGACLVPDELLAVLRVVEASRESRKFIEANKSLCPKIYAIVRNMPKCSLLLEGLKRAISPGGAIKDSASSALQRIRGKKVRLRVEVQKRLQGIQRSAGLKGDGHEDPVTIRDGRYVIPLRTDHRSRIEGIIHDYSQTRATCFIEPVEVIQDNNRMTELGQEEKAEEYRILAGLTAMVRDFSDDLDYCQSLIARLDSVSARARFSEEMSCVMPEIGGDNRVELKGAMNPILLALNQRKADRDQDPPVPVDIRFDGNRNVLIISGPNRGGKTVALKTLGILCLMAQAGIHIPAKEGSRLPVFDQIMADIGDDQDIQSGLSTFSAHAAHLRYMLENADHKSLVIIDEPGMATDPNEGAALTMATLDYLSGQGTSVAVSTHLNRLKTYGLLNNHAANASVEFDTEKGRPTFRLRYGSPGVSHALEVARDMGVPGDIIKEAREYLDRDEVHLNRLIEKLDLLRGEAESEKKEAESARKTYDSAKRVMRERFVELGEEKKSFLEAKRVEAEVAIREAQVAFKEAINLLKRNGKGSQAQAVEKYKETTDRLLSQIEVGADEKFSTGAEELRPGQSVQYKTLGRKGIIKTVDFSTGRAQIMIGNVNALCDIKDLERVRDTGEATPYKTVGTVTWDSERSPQRELNVIGCKVDDAIPLIDRRIDRALVEGDLTLRIIHGFGTGRLRDAIRTHLKDVPFIKRITSADSRFGGEAITVVEL